MRKMFAPPIFSLVFALWICACNSQTQAPVKARASAGAGLVGGPCDGCDIMYVGMPAHIHTFILEPGIGNPYYIDDFVFDDDPLVTDRVRRAMENRGGSGILRARMEGRVQVVAPVTTLCINIPGYPAVQ